MPFITQSITRLHDQTIVDQEIGIIELVFARVELVQVQKANTSRKVIMIMIMLPKIAHPNAKMAQDRMFGAKMEFSIIPFFLIADISYLKTKKSVP